MAKYNPVKITKSKMPKYIQIDIDRQKLQENPRLFNEAIQSLAKELEKTPFDVASIHSHWTPTHLVIEIF